MDENIFLMKGVAPLPQLFIEKAKLTTADCLTALDDNSSQR